MSPVMAARLSEEIKLTKKHEEILAKRAVLLEQMERRAEQHVIMSRAARERNGKLLQDLQRMEARLSSQPHFHPDIATLQERYWASIEEKIPEWEDFLLGRGPPPSGGGGRSPGRRRQSDSSRDGSETRFAGLPPRPGKRRVS